MKNKFLLLLFVFVPIMAVSQNEIENNKIRNIDLNSNILLEPSVMYLEHILDFDIFSLEDNLFTILKYHPDTMSFKNSIHSSHILFSPFNQHIVLPGLGSYNNLGISSEWMPIDNFSMTGATFISKQKTHYSREILFGANGIVRYHFTNRLQLELWGQYFSPSNNDPYKTISGLYPKTSIGTTLLVEPAKNLKVGAGVEYRQNQKKQKWESQSGGKVSFGF